jgi:hypothetical protein
MQPDLHYIHQSKPRFFSYSLDWRFLLPIADTGKIRVVVEDDADLSQTLEQVGITISNQLSFSNFKHDERNNTQSFVLPFGLSVRWVSAREAEQIEFYRSIRQLICPGGYFLLGFGNSWNSHANLQYHPSTPRRVAYELSQAGFKSIKLFGAMPNLRIPEYIFDLRAQSMDFALHHRFRRKPVLLNVLQVLARTVGLARISNFLPCYFVVATI